MQNQINKELGKKNGKNVQKHLLENKYNVYLNQLLIQESMVEQKIIKDYSQTLKLDKFKNFLNCGHFNNDDTDKSGNNNYNIWDDLLAILQQKRVLVERLNNNLSMTILTLLSNKQMIEKEIDRYDKRKENYMQTMVSS